MRFSILFAIVFASINSSADCFPKTKLKIRVTDQKASGISEAEFNHSLDKVEAYYTPIIQGRGAKLQINRLWSDGTVNSDASQPGDGTWVINSYGGLARYPIMSEAGYTLVACHEMGHHLGGAPKFGGWGNDWASIEGQADYFGTIRCMKALGYQSQEIKDASLVLAKVLADLGEEAVPSPDKKDPSVVEKTFEDHPQAQCRLDTYLAGEACAATGDLSETDPSVNTCYGYGVGEIGVRPLCWFKP